MKRFLILAAVFLGIACTGLWLTATAFSAAQDRQVTYTYIADALSERVERKDQVTWLPPETPLSRDFTPGDAAAIGRALGEAWQALAVAQATGQGAVLSDRFSGVALERAGASVLDALATGGQMVVLDQTARPRFFHADGSVFQAEVEMLTARFVVADDGVAFHQVGRDTGIVTLMNESSGWRIFSYERSAFRALEDHTASWSGTIKGVNYYPAETPWRAFWGAFDARVIDADFARIRGLGGNSVRIFLTYDDFTDADRWEAAQGHLRTLLDLADQHGLSVVPTLFDLKPDYGVAGWADDQAYLKRVLPVLAASDVVAFVDLKNEPDLDFASAGQAQVSAWLKTMLAAAKEIAPNLPMTVGWSHGDHAERLLDDLAVVTYHDYAEPAQTRARLARVQDLAADKPVVVTEIGASTYSLAAGFPGSEDAQARELNARIAALADADGVMIWGLNDFPMVDPSVVGPSPWVQRLQGQFGLIRADETEKPAAEVVRSRFRAATN